MLGWALKKGVQGATGVQDAPRPAPGGNDDTTQLDIPDTPAPVFAARALKNAIFGASVPSEPNRRDIKPTDPPRPSIDATSSDARSPAKPNSILLTPGTGTSRRKRVSFGRDVKNNGSPQDGELRLNPDGSRRKTTLQKALENSRSAKPKGQVNNTEPSSGKENEGSSSAAPVSAGEDSEDGWEDEDVCNHDITVDLNEPHSNSGKYWKSELERYHDEARSEMEKLVKYKELAKSYAKMKDAEAVDVSKRLKEEKEKVAKMEKKLDDMAVRISIKNETDDQGDIATKAQELTTQTKLAAQYRVQVQELETLLNDQKDTASPSRRSHHMNTPPRTEQTINEVHRELRRARSELKQMDRLQSENERLRSDLKAAQKQLKTLSDQNQHPSETISLQSRAQRLETQLLEIRDESRRKDAEIRQLKRTYESLKRDAKSRTSEAMQVLQQKNETIQNRDRRIQELEKEVKVLQNHRVSAARARDADTVDLTQKNPALESPRKFTALNVNARPMHTTRRTASVDDISLNMTQRSFISGRDVEEPAIPSKERRASRTLELKSAAHDRVRKPIDGEQRFRSHARQQERDLSTAELDFEIPALDTITKPGLSPTRIRSSRALMDRINESSAPESTGERHGVTVRDTWTGVDRQRRASTRGVDLKGEGSMHGALDSKYLQRRHGSALNTILDGENEIEGIDLMRDQFANLGDVSPKRREVGNVSRCSLPADRQAAARARVQQKRMERQREKEVASSRVMEKENALLA